MLLCCDVTVTIWVRAPCKGAKDDLVSAASSKYFGCATSGGTNVYLVAVCLHPSVIFCYSFPEDSAITWTMEYYRGSDSPGSNEVIHVKLRKRKSARFQLFS